MTLSRNHSNFIRVAHISDLHFSKITLSPRQFLNKRWIGNFNLILFRRKMAQKQHLTELIETFENQKVDLVIISGDLSSTSMDFEFKLASEFVLELKKRNIECLIIPGNHDHYTKDAYQEKLFYQYFTNNTASLVGNYTLKDDRLEIHKMTDKWWTIVLDTVIPTPILSSQGVFSYELEKTLEKALNEVPEGVSLMIVNHFPFFQHDSPHSRLVRGPTLKALLKKHPQVRFYLHGHTHRECIADLRASNIPIVLDAGCCGNIQNAKWHLMDLSDDTLKLTVYKWKNSWEKIKSEEFNLTEKVDQDQSALPVAR
jgi:3',5'-cyclic AMP phosphodiesterase CpdA